MCVNKIADGALCVRISVCVCVFVCLCTAMYVCVCVCVCLCLCVCACACVGSCFGERVNSSPINLYANFSFHSLQCSAVLIHRCGKLYVCVYVCVFVCYEVRLRATSIKVERVGVCVGLRV